MAGVAAKRSPQSFRRLAFATDRIVRAPEERSSLICVPLTSQESLLGLLDQFGQLGTGTNLPPSHNLFVIVQRSRLAVISLDFKFDPRNTPASLPFFHSLTSGASLLDKRGLKFPKR